MIKIVVHSPKGGVGKTTLATNIALFLARKGQRVWAYDLAQRGRMTEFLSGTAEFAAKPGNRMTTEELGELPFLFPGSSNFDYLVADTDDYHKILEGLLEKKRRGWRAVAPMLPFDQTGLIDIPKETAALMKGAFLLTDQRPQLYLVMNKCPGDRYEEGIREVSKAVERHGVGPLLCDAWIPEAEPRYHPMFVDQVEFAEAVDRLLLSMGVRQYVTT